MSHDNYPKGAGLGRDPNPHNPTLIDYAWTMQHGSRAQRREILRQLKQHRRQGVPGAEEAPTMSTEKEKGASPDQAAPQTNDSADSTAPETPRALFHPLTWRPEKPAKFRGKGKRRTRADAIARKRGQWGSASADLLAWLAMFAAFALAGWLAGGVQ